MLRQKVGELQFCAPPTPGHYSISAVRDRCAVLRVMKSGRRKDLYRLNTRPNPSGEHLDCLGAVSFEIREEKPDHTKTEKKDTKAAIDGGDNEKPRRKSRDNKKGRKAGSWTQGDPVVSGRSPPRIELPEIKGVSRHSWSESSLSGAPHSTADL